MTTGNGHQGADSRASDPRRHRKFWHTYDASQLATVEACVQDHDELLVEIAEIERQLIRFHAVPAAAIGDEDRRWLKRAKSALALKHRLRHAINHRKGQLLLEARRAVGEQQLRREQELRRARLQKQLEHEASVRARREREHAEKMARIAASQAQGWEDHRLFVRLVRERFGDEAADTIWAEVHRRGHGQETAA